MVMRKAHRLASRKDIEELFRRGQRTESALFRLVAARNASGRLRFALVAPRAADKRAAARNRIRRRAREWVRRRPGILALPYDAAIVFKKQAVGAPRPAFYKDLEFIFSRLGLLRKD